MFVGEPNWFQVSCLLLFFILFFLIRGFEVFVLLSELIWFQVSYLLLFFIFIFFYLGV